MKKLQSPNKSYTTAIAHILLMLALIVIAPSALAMNLPNGGVVAGEISVSGEIDEFTFSADAGDTVFIRVADTESTPTINSDFSPRVELVNPSGALVTSGGGFLVGTIQQFLIVSGTYTVRVRDSSPGADDETGSYDLYYANAPGANDDGVLPNGGVVTGVIDLGDIDSYTFNANAGETVFLRVADTETTEFIPSDFTPRIVLLDPSGSIVTSDSGFLVGALSNELVVTGTYTVIVTDSSLGEDDQTGSYDLYYAKAPGANDDGCIADGQSANGFIDLGDIDSYSFLANAGTSMVVTVTDLDDGPLVPSVILLGPAGNVITSNSGFVTAQISRNLTVTGEHTLIIVDASSGEDDAEGNYRIDISGVNITCPALECNGQAITVNIGNGQSPTAQADVILGTSGADIINGLAGNDTICGLGGNDIISGGTGNDWVDAGAGNDTIRGNSGEDVLFGDDGDDTIRGGSDGDEIFGEAGDDTLLGQGGEDTIDGGDGVDDNNGGGGRDTLLAGSGATVGTGKLVFGGSGIDTIIGGPDADDLRGGNGNDIIDGLGGDDFITGGLGLDVIDGGAGADMILGNNARDTLSGGSGNDVIEGGSQSDTLNGGGGVDTLIGGAETMSSMVTAAVMCCWVAQAMMH